MAAAVAKAPKVLVHPPASPFAELLRRSKFATYDPAIRQTYSAAPANAHRGDWGLKRPISLRRKNAFVSLTSFEHPAHFTEWNHAENQVRFIRRVEEMGVLPEAIPGTPWYRSLGKATTELLLDSDFCPGEKSAVRVKKTKEELEKEEAEKPTTVPLDALGKRGPGAYGTQRKPVPKNRRRRVEDEEENGMEVYVTANVDAMSTREFERYLTRLRAQRPDFQKHIDAAERVPVKNLYALAQDADQGYHRRFMMEHMAGGYADLGGRQLEPQPHPNGALTYTRPTALETVLWTRPQSGIILNAHSTDRGSSEKKYVASFGGLGAVLRHHNMGPGKAPLLDVASEEGVDQARVSESIVDMRLLPRRGLLVQRPPKVVGNKPQGLKGVKLVAEVMADIDSTRFRLDNPHPLGSPAYVAQPPVDTKSTPRPLVPKSKPVRPTIPLKQKDTTKLLGTLQSLMNSKPVSDQDL